MLVCVFRAAAATAWSKALQEMGETRSKLEGEMKGAPLFKEEAPKVTSCLLLVRSLLPLALALPLSPANWCLVSWFGSIPGVGLRALLLLPLRLPRFCMTGRFAPKVSLLLVRYCQVRSKVQQVVEKQAERLLEETLAPLLRLFMLPVVHPALDKVCSLFLACSLWLALAGRPGFSVRCCRPWLLLLLGFARIP